ncbi:MAG: energy transducer TonB [Zoogloeaceae bacterium]|nr:energy transducer TonB [Rhodocyclaceae bacterium]MCP5236452.1 energy transducer TonB [Zoogloeaceae bacterium]
MVPAPADRITTVPVAVTLLSAPVAPVESTAPPPAVRAEPTPPPKSQPTTAQPSRQAKPVVARPRPRPAPRRPRRAAEPAPTPTTIAAADVPQLDQPVPDSSSPASPQQHETAARATPPTLPTRTEARFDAAYLANPRPAYPAQSRRLGEQGTVVLRVRVATDGAAANVTLHRSSGFVRLDRAAIDAVSRWRFVPARLGEDAIASWVQVPIAFTLEY